MEQDPEYDIFLIIVFIGDSGTGAGKTCFIHSYVKDTFSDPNMSTIRVDLCTKIVDVRGKKVKLQMWDTDGNERFMSLERAYFKLADGFVVGYDITSRDSFETAKRRYINLRRDYPNAVIMVIGNKVDLVNDEPWNRAVPYEEGDELANEVGASLFFESKLKMNCSKIFLFSFLFTASAKTGFNMNESMSALVEEILMTNGILNEMGGWVFMSQ